MKAARVSSWLALSAASLAIAAPASAEQPVKTVGGWLASTCILSDSNAAFILATFAGTAAAAAILAVIFRRKALASAQQSLWQTTRLETLSTIEANYRSLLAVEPQACVIWNEEHPRLAVHTLPAVLGVPSKLTQILRLASWLHPDDSSRITIALSRLQTRGEAFVANASTLDGHVIELAGAVCGAETVLRIRPFSPVNKELVRLIGENKRLKQALAGRDKLLDSLPVPVWLRDEKSILTWVNAAYAAATGVKSREEALEKQMELFETRQRSELHRLSQTKNPGRMKLQTVVNGAVQVYEAILDSVRAR